MRQLLLGAHSVFLIGLHTYNVFQGILSEACRPILFQSAILVLAQLAFYGLDLVL